MCILIVLVVPRHLCFKQAQPNMFHSPKIENGVETWLYSLLGQVFLFLFILTLNCHKS